VLARAARTGRTSRSSNRRWCWSPTTRLRAATSFRAAFAPYYATPVYNAFLAWAGLRGTPPRPSAKAGPEGSREDGGALTDAMIDEIAIIGDEDECPRAHPGRCGPAACTRTSSRRWRPPARTTCSARSRHSPRTASPPLTGASRAGIGRPAPDRVADRRKHHREEAYHGLPEDHRRHIPHATRGSGSP